MFYADDSQLYITVDPLDQRSALNTLQRCIIEVIELNTINKLVCNLSKTEVIQFSSRFVKNLILSDFLIGNSTVQPSDWLCNLGVSLDRELNVSHHWRFDLLADSGSIWAMITLIQQILLMYFAM